MVLCALLFGCERINDEGTRDRGINMDVNDEDSGSGIGSDANNDPECDVSMILNHLYNNGNKSYLSLFYL